MWAVALLLTLSRGLIRWHSQRQIFADDYFIFGGILSLTALTAVITCLLPQFYLAGSYTAALMQDPTTPLPPDAFLARTQDISQAYVQPNVAILDEIMDRYVLQICATDQIQPAADQWQQSSQFSSFSAVS